MPRKESGNARKVTSVRLGSFHELKAIADALTICNEASPVPVTVSSIARDAAADFCRAWGVDWPGDEKEPTNV